MTKVDIKRVVYRDRAKFRVMALQLRQHQCIAEAGISCGLQSLLLLVPSSGYSAPQQWLLWLPPFALSHLIPFR